MKRKLLYEGKAKIMYEGTEPGTIIQYFKDDITAFNKEKHAVLSGKGVLNNAISAFLMSRLGDIGIPTHFIKKLNPREQLVHDVEILPIEVIVRNIAAGTLSKRYKVEEGTELDRALIEFCYKNDEMGDPLVGEDALLAFNWAASDEIEHIKELSLRINDFMCGLFTAIGIVLVDFKLEFGRLYLDEDQHILVLADEISPDSCRLWDRKSKEKLDKDRFRSDLGNVLEAYQEIAKRLNIRWNSDNDQ